MCLAADVKRQFSWAGSRGLHTQSLDLECIHSVYCVVFGRTAAKPGPVTKKSLSLTELSDGVALSVGWRGWRFQNWLLLFQALAVLNYILRRLFYSEAQIIDITIDCPCKNKHVDHIGYSHRLGFELVFFLWFIAELRLGNIREITHPLS